MLCTRQRFQKATPSSSLPCLKSFLNGETGRLAMGKWRPNDSWLSRLVPFGLVGQTKPHHYRELLGVVWENKTELPYAWNILKHGVCDGCSLGPYGLRDNVMDGVH